MLIISYSFLIIPSSESLLTRSDHRVDLCGLNYPECVGNSYECIYDETSPRLNQQGVEDIDRILSTPVHSHDHNTLPRKTGHQEHRRSSMNRNKL